MNMLKKCISLSKMPFFDNEMERVAKKAFKNLNLSSACAKKPAQHPCAGATRTQKALGIAGGFFLL